MVNDLFRTSFVLFSFDSIKGNIIEVPSDTKVSLLSL